MRHERAGRTNVAELVYRKSGKVEEVGRYKRPEHLQAALKGRKADLQAAMEEPNADEKGKANLQAAIEEPNTVEKGRPDLPAAQEDPNAGEKGKAYLQAAQEDPNAGEKGEVDDIVMRLFVVEDLSRDVIEMLGEQFNIDPHVFRAHIFDNAWYNIRDLTWDPPSPKIDIARSGKDWRQGEMM